MSDKLLDEIVASLPIGFVKDLIEARPKVYQESYEFVTSGQLPLGESDAEGLWPYARRARFETKLREIAGNHGLKTGIEPNSVKNFKYSVVKSGRFLMTCSHVNKDISNLSPAEFRKQHASLNALIPQALFLFEPVIPEPILEPGDLYAIILHCIERKDQPGFLKLGIPSENNSRWERSYDFSEILAAYPNVVTETESDTGVKVKWKKQRKTGEV